MKNKICVYAIAKDEIKNVDAWYNSMKHADKVIVLDTGSTDGTRRRLTELGCDVYLKVYDKFEFDVARNDSLSLVPDEYNIRVCTDLDEWFDNDEWADVVRDNWIEGVHERCEYQYTWNHLENGQDGHTFPYNKIHSKNWHWRDKIHESLCRIDNGERIYHIENTLALYDDNRIHLHHYQDLSRNREWYVGLAYERLADHRDDAFAWLELQRELLAKRRIDECIQLSGEMLNNPEVRSLFNVDDLASVYHQMGLAHTLNDNPVDAIISFTSGMSFNMKYKDNYLDLMRVYSACGMYDLAIGVGKTCASIGENRRHWTESALANAWGIDFELAFAYLNSGDRLNALFHIEKAIRMEPENETLLNLKKDIVSNI